MNPLHQLLKLPFKRGRLLWTPDIGDALMVGQMAFQTNLKAQIIRGAGTRSEHREAVVDLGSGLVTFSGVLGLALDPSVGDGLPFFKRCKNMGSGTGATAAAATDWHLQTANGTGTAASVITSGQSGNNSTLQYVATLNYGSTLAITEWGLFTGATLGSNYTTSSDTITATTVTPTSGPGWSANQWSGFIVTNPGVPTAFFPIVSNISTAITNGYTGWMSTSGGTASTPGNNTQVDIQPLMWDHKVFSALNVNSGDAIQYTYTLTINSGG